MTSKGGKAGFGRSEPDVEAGARARLLLLSVLTLACLLLSAAPARAVTVPVGFDDQLVTSVPRPVALAWTPDDRMLIATHTGFVRIYKDGALLSSPAIDLRPQLCRSDEWGVSGIAVDPDFTSNHYVYIYYTFNKFNSCATDSPTSPVNRVSRFVLGSNDRLDPLSETVIVDGIQDPDGIHAGGDITIANDGYLYVNTGDGGCDFRGDSGCYLLNDAAQDLGVLSGKILRVTTNGGIPASNPFQGTDSVRCSPNGFTAVDQKCQEIYAYGLRNPFRGGFDPNSQSTRFFINDVGADTWEEINDGQIGANYGWNVREGNCARGSSTDCGPQPAGMTNPIHSYNHSSGCVSVTAGDFVPNGVWPAQYDDTYMFGDLVCGNLWTLAQGPGGYTPTLFASGITSLIDGVFGPYNSTQAFYYMSWQGFSNDEIHRIVYTGESNRPPDALATADPTAGGRPLTVNFNGSGSTDPDNDTITYDWNFGDGSAHSTAANPTHTYTSSGVFDAVLTVTDEHSATDSRTIQITVGNDPPQPSIDVPAPNYQFAVGDQITLVGGADDTEDGGLPNSSLTWRVDRHHDTHTHPFLSPTDGNYIPITAPPPEDLLAATNSYLQVYLTATDSGGLSTTVERDIFPRKVNVTFNSNPNLFNLEVAGSPITTQHTVTSWVNWDLVVNAPDQADPQGRWWVFNGWSDGGAAQHTITTPATDSGYTANFKQLLYPRPGGATPLRVPLVPEYAPCTNPNTSHIAPLIRGSCGPPQLQSQLLTTSTIGQGKGFVQLNVVPGNPGTPADEADVMVHANVTDVRLSQTGQDYTGKLILRNYLRMTDRANGSSQVVPATADDLDFSIPINCVASPLTSVGSSCNVNSTLDTLVPGVVKEGKRAVVSDFSVSVLDQGPDGDIDPIADPVGLGCPPSCGSGDEAVFEGQGIFAP